MLKSFMAALALALSAMAAHATTVTSNTIDQICNAEVVLYGSPAAGGQVVIYRGAVARGGISLQLYPNQGNRVCYRRGVNPHDCGSPLTQPVCAPVTPNPSDTLDIR